MNANARVMSIPLAKKSRKKGRRDKPFREFKMHAITMTLLEYDENPEPPTPKQYIPQPITDFSPPAGITNPKTVKKLRRKHCRKQQKELAKRADEQAKHKSQEAAEAEEAERTSKKRKAIVDHYERESKKKRSEETDAHVGERKKLEPKSRKPKSEAKGNEPPNVGPEPKLGDLPWEILQDIFGYHDPFQRTCIALTCKTFGAIIMQDLLDLKRQSARKAREAEKAKAEQKNAQQASQNTTVSDTKKNSKQAAKKEDERKVGNRNVGFPDLRKRYNWDGERHVTMEHLHSSIAPDHLYCTVCRKFKPKNGGTVTSYKNCPKKNLMAVKPHQHQNTNEQRPASMLSQPKTEREKPIPDEIIWTEEDWSVFKIGAIRSRMGIVQTHYLCPSCTDSRNGFLFPPQPEVPLERFMEFGNPIGGDVKNGRVPYGQKGPNVRDPRRRYPPDEKLATVEEHAREAGKGPDREEINNG